jgi:hypothetical protein
VDGIGLPTDEGCARCHEEVAAEWRESLHHHAWQNPYFARAYHAEQTPFCRKCHAPGADPSAEPPPREKELGVGCTTCHVVPTGIVGPRPLAASGITGARALAAPKGAAPGGHAVLGDARLATPAACGGCHQFEFPAPSGHASGPPMQDTLGEHERSAAATTACQGCHMPEVPSRGGGAHRSHAFRVQGDKAMLAQAVEVTSAALGKGEVRLSLAPGRVGHAFPTGDLFRQVEVRARPVDASGRPTGAASREILGRTFAASRAGQGSFVNAQRSDRRLSGPRTLALAVPPGTRRARWEIVWQRMPPWLAESLGMIMSDHETVVLEGTVTR